MNRTPCAESYESQLLKLWRRYFGMKGIIFTDADIENLNHQPRLLGTTIAMFELRNREKALTYEEEEEESGALSR